MNSNFSEPVTIVSGSKNLSLVVIVEHEILGIKTVVLREVPI